MPPLQEEVKTTMLLYKRRTDCQKDQPFRGNFRWDQRWIRDHPPCPHKTHPFYFSPQETVTRDGKETTVSIKGRHDPVIVPRAVVVVEAMTALTILDALLLNRSTRMDALYGSL